MVTASMPYPKYITYLNVFTWVALSLGFWMWCVDHQDAKWVCTCSTLGSLLSYRICRRIRREWVVVAEVELALGSVSHICWHCKGTGKMMPQLGVFECLGCDGKGHIRVSAA